MPFLLFHKQRQQQGIYLLRFHHDPPSTTDSRSTDWSGDPTPGAIAPLEVKSVGARVIAFTVIFNDFASGKPLTKADGYRSTRDSIRWLKQRQQANPPLWDKPPTLIFTGARPETGAKRYFEGVIVDAEVTSKITAGREVLARPELLSFPADPDDIVRAEVKITLKENYDPGDLGQPSSLSEAFVFGVREGARREGQ